MESSSSSNQPSEEHPAFSGIELPRKRSKFSESSRLYDVIINHRGPDVKETLARQIYNSLQELGIRAFLDPEERELGDSFLSTIETAIRSASVHIAIFSKTYAESPWCLAELVLMLQSKAKIIPLFYDVSPQDLRYIEKGVYANAFITYKEKARYREKLEEWKEALQAVSFISGVKVNSSSDRTNIVSAVENELKGLKRKLHKHVQDFESQCLDELIKDFESQSGMKKEGKHKAKIVGIYGMAGAGKTTLSKELFNRKRFKYTQTSFLYDVREASATCGLPSLQMELLKDIFNREPPNFQSVEEGKGYLKDCRVKSRSLNFLIVLDDIDHVAQLDALLIMDMITESDDCLVIITTRNVGVLTSGGITNNYNLKGMNRDHATKLFCWHALDDSHPAGEYVDLVDRFIVMCEGLPLSLKVLGRHVHGRARNYWWLELNKVRESLSVDLKQILQISFNALHDEEKQIFMDIACFFIDKSKSMAMKIWEASEWSAQHALETLKDKCLVEEIQWKDGVVLRMHDHLRDMGREMAKALRYPHRLWRPQVLESLKFTGFQKILTESNSQSLRCFNSIFDWSICITYFLGHSDYYAETVLLWLALDLQDKLFTSIPPWIPLQNLRGLRISNGGINILWHRNVQVPFQLRSLVLYRMSSFQELESIEMLEHLEELVLSGDLLLKGTMVMEGSSLSESLRKLTKLKSLVLSHFRLRGELELSSGRKSFSLQHPVSSLLNMEIATVELVSKVLVCGRHCPKLESLRISGMEDLLEVDLSRVTTLGCLKLEYCTELKTVSGISDLKNLVMLYLLDCPKLQKLSSLAHMSRLESITVDKCAKLQNIEGIEELQRLKHLHVSKVTGSVGDKATCHTIHSLKIQPSVISVFGRAVPGAESAFNEDLFSDVIKQSAVPTASMKTAESLSAIIVCALVDCHMESLLIEVPSPPNNCIMGGLPVPDRDRQRSRLPAGEWMITMAISGDYALHYIAQSSWFRNKGNKNPQIKKGCMVTVNKSDEGKTLQLFKKIISELYYEFK